MNFAGHYINPKTQYWNESKLPDCRVDDPQGYHPSTFIFQILEWSYSTWWRYYWC